jgi:hypothetical protein
MEDLVPEAESTIPTKCISMTEEHFLDLAGRFPYKSNSNLEYLLIIYYDNANYIQAELMSLCSGKKYPRTYQASIGLFKDIGITMQYPRI